MKRLLLLLLCASSISAAERGYQFTVKHGDHGIRLEDGAGTHWKWVEIGCPTAKPKCEWMVNDHSGGGIHRKDADFSIAERDAATVQMRCLRPHCTFRFDDQTKTLPSEQAVAVPVNARVSVSFVDER